MEELIADRWPPKDPGAKLQYGVNFEQECARHWERWTDFAAGVRIRVYVPGQQSGFEFESSGGRSSGRMPIFPTISGQTVVDGSITWAARALSSSSLIRSISGTPAWTADSGITVSSQAISGMLASAYMDAGIDGQEYSIVVVATMSDGEVVPKVGMLTVARAA